MNSEVSGETPIEQLRQIMIRLRSPESGCAWDIRQTFESIAPFTLEEAYEVVDAIERSDADDLQDELGDLLFQVIFHSQMASELELFDFDDVTRNIVEKMIRRHPHVFSDARYGSELEQKKAWESIKALERQQKLDRKTKRLKTSLSTEEGFADDSDCEQDDLNQASILDGVARNQTALKLAQKLQKRAASIGFDWPVIDPVWNKLDEEIAEVKQAIDQDNQFAVTDEIGDLLFTVVNLARHLGVDAETALRHANQKFEMRFRQVEQLASEQDMLMSEADLADLDKLWNLAKTKNRK